MNVPTVLEILWTYERVMASETLLPEEKQVITKELNASIPHVMHSSGCVGTRDIVAKHLNPPSKDEAKVGNTAGPRPPANTSLSDRDNSNKKEAHQKAGSPRQKA